MSKVSDVMRIDGVYYDTKKLADVHPGGELVVLMCNKQDATALFNSSHRRAFPHERYLKFVVPEDKVDAESKLPPNTQKFDTYFELCEKVKPILAKTGGFATWEYYIKVIFILGMIFAMDFMNFYGPRPMWASIVQGLFFAWAGLNIQHDANHGAVSKSSIVNRVLGLSQDIIGGSQLSWMMNHNTIHHVFCNDTGLDHDLDIPLLRLHKKIAWKMPYQMQQVYFVILEALFGPVHVLSNFVLIMMGPGEREKIFSHHWNLSRVTSMIIPARFLLCMYAGNTFTQALGEWFLSYAIGGLYLAFFFIISHNFVGAKKETINARAGDFVRNQVETSSNVGGEYLAMANGGLNFQIEHHLFPRVHHSNYHKLAPVVREVCKKKGIQYIHFATIWDNFYSTYKHLMDLGQKPVPA